jgi:hypothetical protein
MDTTLLILIVILVAYVVISIVQWRRLSDDGSRTPE